MAGSRPSMASRSSCPASRVISACSFCASFARILGSREDRGETPARPPHPGVPARSELLTLSSSAWDTPLRALEVLAGDGALETASSPASASAVLMARLARAFSICSCGRGRRNWVTAGRKEKFPLHRPHHRPAAQCSHPSASDPSLPALRMLRGVSSPLPATKLGLRAPLSLKPVLEPNLQH